MSNIYLTLENTDVKLVEDEKSYTDIDMIRINLQGSSFVNTMISKNKVSVKGATETFEGFTVEADSSKHNVSVNLKKDDVEVNFANNKLNSFLYKGMDMLKINPSMEAYVDVDLQENKTRLMFTVES